MRHRRGRQLSPYCPDAQRDQRAEIGAVDEPLLVERSSQGDVQKLEVQVVRKLGEPAVQKPVVSVVQKLEAPVVRRHQRLVAAADSPPLQQEEKVVAA